MDKVMIFEYNDGSRFKITVPGDGTLTFDGIYKGEPSQETVQLLFTRMISPGVYMVAWREHISPAVVTQIHNFNDKKVFSSIADTVRGTATFLEGSILFENEADSRETSNDNVE